MTFFAILLTIDIVVLFYLVVVDLVVVVICELLESDHTFPSYIPW